MKIGGKSYDSGNSIIHSDNVYAKALTEKVGKGSFVFETNTENQKTHHVNKIASMLSRYVLKKCGYLAIILINLFKTIGNISKIAFTTLL